MSDPDLLTSRDGAVAIVTINRPDRLNALDASLLEGLASCAADFEAESLETRPRALIITGQGDKAFVAGADLGSMVELESSEARRFSELGQRLGRTLEEASFAVLAAVNGFALGGGCELALCADLIVASDRARFGQPEINLGLIPGFGGTIRLSRRIGVGQANRLILTGEPIDAARALELGLADAVVPHAELLPKTLELAKKIAAKPPLAIAAAKRSLLRGRSSDAAIAADHETQCFAGLFATADAREGMRAFLEKRTPTFRGK
jgi:enoyl-CoA hydratase